MAADRIEGRRLPACLAVRGPYIHTDARVRWKNKFGLSFCSFALSTVGSLFRSFDLSCSLARFVLLIDLAKDAP